MAILIGPNNTPGGKTPYKDLLDLDFAPGGKENSVAGDIPDLQQGTPSLFNPYSLVVFPNADGTAFHRGEKLTNKIIDGGSQDGVPGFSGNLFSPSAEESSPTISKLVNDEKLAKKTPYYYTDFLYCKYVGKIPLNQLITLRRYAAPTFDNLAVPSTNMSASGEVDKSGNSIAPPTTGKPNVVEQLEFFPIAQAVTWFGEETENKLSEILSFTVTMNWKMVEAEGKVCLLIKGNVKKPAFCKKAVETTVKKFGKIKECV